MKSIVFNNLDANSDNKVTAEEFFTAIGKQDQEQEQLFQREDKNGDGIIEFEEFDGPQPPPRGNGLGPQGQDSIEVGANGDVNGGR